MKSNRIKSLFFILCLVAASGIALAYSDKFSISEPVTCPKPVTVTSNSPGVLTLSGGLVQDKVLQGSDGRVTLSLDITADAAPERPLGDERSVDMVIVLDRSGSMRGRKIEYAKRAIANLLAGLTEKDRFALIAYSDGVQKLTDLVRVTDDHRAWLTPMVYGIRPGGGTNLGAGLMAGIEALRSPSRERNAGRVILIS